MKPACSTLFSSFYGERNYEAIRRFNQGAIFWQKRKKYTRKNLRWRVLSFQLPAVSPVVVDSSIRAENQAIRAHIAFALLMMSHNMTEIAAFLMRFERKQCGG
jgi:hypothetical protein